MQARRLKKKKQIILDAIARGINVPGGLVRVVYSAAPLDKKARSKVAKLRYHALGAIHSGKGRPKKVGVT
ncbi:MAG: hypothetical protein ACPLTR_03880 [Thermacetogeniaceae bacterium]